MMTLLPYMAGLSSYLPFASAAGVVPSAPSNSYSTPQQRIQQAVGANNYPGGGSYQAAPANNSGGGGGGGGSRPASSGGGGSPAPNLSAPQQPDISAQVNSAYDSAYGALNDWQNQLQGNQQNFIQSYTAPYDALVPQAQQAYQSGMNLNQSQVANNNQQSANAIAAARALYNEVQQGASQRFGGSTGVGTGVSSAADFANAFYNKALGQNQSQIYNTQSQNANNLAGQANTINSQYQNQLATIDKQKAAASDQAQQIFQQELQQIASQKVQLGVDKAQQQLSALQNYQNNLNAIQQQANQLSSNLSLQNNAAALGLQGGVGAYGTFANTPYNTQAYGAPQYATPGAAPTQQSNGMFIAGAVGNPNQQNQNGLPPGFGYGQQVF